MVRFDLSSQNYFYAIILVHLTIITSQGNNLFMSLLRIRFLIVAAVSSMPEITCWLGRDTSVFLQLPSPLGKLILFIALWYDYIPIPNNVLLYDDAVFSLIIYVQSYTI